MNFCECGQPLLQTASDSTYMKTLYDEKGEIIYAVCQHGNVVINNLPTDNITRN